MITYLGYRVTANQLAKMKIEDGAANAVSFWHEDSSIEWDTVKERETIEASLARHLDRVQRFINTPALRGRKTKRTKAPARK